LSGKEVDNCKVHQVQTLYIW